MVYTYVKMLNFIVKIQLIVHQSYLNKIVFKTYKLEHITPLLKILSNFLLHLE